LLLDKGAVFLRHYAIYTFAALYHCGFVFLAMLISVILAGAPELITLRLLVGQITAP